MTYNRTTGTDVQAPTEPYRRSTDDAWMIAIAPGVFVNEVVWHKLMGAK